jgi:hypothetical protein
VGASIRRGVVAYDAAILVGMLVLIVHDIATQRPIAVGDGLTVLVVLSLVPQCIRLI